MSQVTKPPVTTGVTPPAQSELELLTDMALHADRLEAWAEFHEFQLRNCHPSEEARHRNTAHNYRLILKIMRQAHQLMAGRLIMSASNVYDV